MNPIIIVITRTAESLAAEEMNKKRRNTMITRRSPEKRGPTITQKASANPPIIKKIVTIYLWGRAMITMRISILLAILRAIPRTDENSRMITTIVNTNQKERIAMLKMEGANLEEEKNHPDVKNLLLTSTLQQAREERIPDLKGMKLILIMMISISMMMIIITMGIASKSLPLPRIIRN